MNRTWRLFKVFTITSICRPPEQLELTGWNHNNHGSQLKIFVELSVMKSFMNVNVIFTHNCDYFTPIILRGLKCIKLIKILDLVIFLCIQEITIFSPNREKLDWKCKQSFDFFNRKYMKSTSTDPFEHLQEKELRRCTTLLAP